MNEGEKEMLKLGTAFKDLIEHPAWKRYEEITKSQIAVRQQIVATPLGKVSAEALPGVDFMERVAGMESIKGTLYGLQLALDTVHNTIATADDLRQTLTPKEE